MVRMKDLGWSGCEFESLPPSSFFFKAMNALRKASRTLKSTLTYYVLFSPDSLCHGKASISRSGYRHVALIPLKNKNKWHIMCRRRVSPSFPRSVFRVIYIYSGTHIATSTAGRKRL